MLGGAKAVNQVSGQSSPPETDMDEDGAKENEDVGNRNSHPSSCLLEKASDKSLNVLRTPSNRQVV
jgi:hypothetical protein